MDLQTAIWSEAWYSDSIALIAEKSKNSVVDSSPMITSPHWLMTNLLQKVFSIFKGPVFFFRGLKCLPQVSRKNSVPYDLQPSLESNEFSRVCALIHLSDMRIHNERCIPINND